MTLITPPQKQTKWGGTKRRTYRLTTDIFITYTRYLLEYTRGDSDPPPVMQQQFEIAQNIQGISLGINASIADSLQERK